MDIRIKKSINVLTQIIEDLGFDNPKQFSDSLGFERPERIYKILRGNTAVSRNLAEIINSKYPQYKIDWLLTGEGEMLKSLETQSNIADPAADYKLNDVQAMHQDLKKDLNILAEGMIKNFEVISTGVMQGLMDQRKLLDWTEKIDPDKINKSSKALDEFLKQNQ